MLTSEVLNRAADLIEERGWATGASGDPWGERSAAAPLCLEGGIATAAGLRGLTGLGLLESCPAARAVHDYLTTQYETLWEWNDQYGGVGPSTRTASEVIEVLRAAAAIEQAREAELTPAPRSVLTSPALLEQAADKHGVPVVVVDGYYSAILWRPSGEAILWRAVVPESERVALGLAVA